MSENKYYGVMGTENNPSDLEKFGKNTSKTPPPAKPTTPPGGSKQNTSQKTNNPQ